MPRSKSLSKSKSKSKSRTRSLNIERMRENKKKHNASNKIKKFIRHVNNKHKGKRQISQRNFNRAYQEQEQSRQELYRRRHIPLPFLGTSRPMSNEELNLYAHTIENTSLPYYPEAKTVPLARPENKRKTEKYYRSVAMLVPEHEEYLRLRLDHANRIKQLYIRELYALYAAGSELNQSVNNEETRDLDLQIEEKRRDIEQVNREIERLENPPLLEITTQKPVHIPEARHIGRGNHAAEHRPSFRPAINLALGLNSRSINRYAKSGALVDPYQLRAEHVGRTREEIQQEIDRIVSIEQLSPEEMRHLQYLRQLLRN
jgi:hypothetical protein